MLECITKPFFIIDNAFIPPILLHFFVRTSLLFNQSVPNSLLYRAFSSWAPSHTQSCPTTGNT